MLLWQMSEDTVYVALRIRPLVENEIKKGCQACLEVIPGESQICICNTNKAFTYNYVFPPGGWAGRFFFIIYRLNDY